MLIRHLNKALPVTFKHNIPQKRHHRQWAKHKYRYRPVHGSHSLLIEFVNGVENKDFGPDMFDAIKEINPKLEGREDLWMNDEILFTINSDFGQFTLSKDIRDMAFLMADHNQSCIFQINNLLLNDNRFEKIDLPLMTSNKMKMPASNS